MATKEGMMQEVCRWRDKAEVEMNNAAKAFNAQSNVVSILEKELGEARRRLVELQGDYKGISSVWLDYYLMAKQMEEKEAEE